MLSKYIIEIEITPVQPQGVVGFARKITKMSGQETSEPILLNHYEMSLEQFMVTLAYKMNERF